MSFLSENKIGIQGVQALSEAIKHNFSLTLLDIQSENMIFENERDNGH